MVKFTVYIIFPFHHYCRHNKRFNYINLNDNNNDDNDSNGDLDINNLDDYNKIIDNHDINFS